MRLHELRVAAGLSLRDLERLTGVGRSRLSQLETDDRPNPSLSVLLALQQALGLDSIEALLGHLPSQVAGADYGRHDRARLDAG